MTKRRSSAGWRVRETMTDAASRRPATTKARFTSDPFVPPLGEVDPAPLGAPAAAAKSGNATA